jgi:hypothetical protein
MQVAADNRVRCVTVKIVVSDKVDIVFASQRPAGQPATTGS